MKSKELFILFLTLCYYLFGQCRTKRNEFPSFVLVKITINNVFEPKTRGKKTRRNNYFLRNIFFFTFCYCKYYCKIIFFCCILFGSSVFFIFCLNKQISKVFKFLPFFSPSIECASFILRYILRSFVFAIV